MECCRGTKRASRCCERPRGFITATKRATPDLAAVMRGNSLTPKAHFTPDFTLPQTRDDGSQEGGIEAVGGWPAGLPNLFESSVSPSDAYEARDETGKNSAVKLSPISPWLWPRINQKPACVSRAKTAPSWPGWRGEPVVALRTCLDTHVRVCVCVVRTHVNGA